MSSRLMQLVAIGDVLPSLLRDLELPLTTQLGVTPVYSRVSLATPSYAYNKDRNQYHSNAIMRRLVPLLEPGQSILGVVEVDLFVPDSGFVFGEADRESRAAGLSIARLKQGA